MIEYKIVKGKKGCGAGGKQCSAEQKRDIIYNI